MRRKSDRPIGKHTISNVGYSDGERPNRIGFSRWKRAGHNRGHGNHANVDRHIPRCADGRHLGNRLDGHLHPRRLHRLELRRFAIRLPLPWINVFDLRLGRKGSRQPRIAAICGNDQRRYGDVYGLGFLE